MKSYILIILCLCLAILPGYARQNNVSIHGKVVDKNKNPITGVAVILQRPDSTYIQAVITDTAGFFVFSKGITPYRLLFQHISYKSGSIESTLEDVGIVILEEEINTLAELVIKAERPVMKFENNRFSYNIANIAADKVADNTFDLIKELPNISSSGDVINITGAGSGTSIVMNGKATAMNQSQLTEFLKALPPNRIEKIELVYNAPPQWHVKGAAINIVLKKSDNYSLQGQTQGRWEYRKYSSYSGSGNLYISTPQTSFDFIYSFHDRNTPNRSEIFSRHTLHKETFDISSSIVGKSTARMHSFYAGFSYNISQKDHLNVIYNGQYSPKNVINKTTSSNLFSSALSSDSGNNYLHNIKVSYGSHYGLDIGGEYVNYNTNMLQEMCFTNRNPELAPDDFRYNRVQEINKCRFYADMSHNLGENWNISYGAKYDYTHNRNTQLYSYMSQSAQPLESSMFENTANIYASVKKNFFSGKLNFDLSLTGEIYKMNDYKRNSFLPNATVSYVPSQKHLVQFTYNTLRAYPSYWSIQDYVSRNDEYSVSYGNPALRPMQYNIMSLVYTLKSKYMLVVSYYRVKDFILGQGYQSTEKLELIYKPVNIDFSSAFMANLIIPIKIGSLFSSTFTGTLYNERYKNSEWFGLSYDKNKWAIILKADNVFRISKQPNIIVNANAFYQTRTNQGLWDMSDVWCVNAGLKWSFIKDKAGLSFMCNDIFQSRTFYQTIRYNTQYQDLDNNFYKRSFMLSFTYKFKGYRERRKQNTDISRFGTDI